jgi:hypothetical protein
MAGSKLQPFQLDFTNSCSVKPENIRFILVIQLHGSCSSGTNYSSPADGVPARLKTNAFSRLTLNGAKFKRRRFQSEICSPSLGLGFQSRHLVDQVEDETIWL